MKTEFTFTPTTPETNFSAKIKLKTEHSFTAEYKGSNNVVFTSVKFKK